MPPDRKALALIKQNHIRNNELSPFRRGLIVGSAWAGAKPAYITEAMSLAKSTIKNTIKLNPLRNEGES